jgi:hypothetical protein
LHKKFDLLKLTANNSNQAKEIFQHYSITVW